jgi:hypothetical protein
MREAAAALEDRKDAAGGVLMEWEMGMEGGGHKAHSGVPQCVTTSTACVVVGHSHTGAERAEMEHVASVAPARASADAATRVGTLGEHHGAVV